MSEAPKPQTGRVCGDASVPRPSFLFEFQLQSSLAPPPHRRRYLRPVYIPGSSKFHRIESVCCDLDSSTSMTSIERSVVPGHVSGRVCTRVIVSPCKRCHQTWPLVAAVKPPATSRMRHLSRWLVPSTRQLLRLCQDGGKLSRAT